MGWKENINNEKVKMSQKISGRRELEGTQQEREWEMTGK